MTAHTTGEDRSVSGEAWRVVQAAMAEHAGDDNPSRVARNILHALRNAGFSVSRTAAPTAPSTAAGEPALVCGCGWEGSYADLNETAEGMTCPKCRLSRNMDCAATPPAQGVEEENETLENLIDAAIGARTAPPWEEQAARQCEEWADKLVERASAAPSTFERIQFNADAVKLRDHARAFRAMLSKPAKGDG